MDNAKFSILILLIFASGCASFISWMDNPVEDSKLVVVKGLYDIPPESIGGLAAIQSQVTYPPMAIEAGVGGHVTLQALINKEGHVENIVILKGRPNTGLDEVSINALKRTKFKPAFYGDVPVAVRIQITFKFLGGTVVVR